MFRPNFYVDIDTINFILQMELDGELEDFEFSMDVVEIPFYFIYSSDDEGLKLKVMKRVELHTINDDGIDCGTVTINKNGEGTAEVTSAIGDNAFAFIECSRRISKFIQSRNLAAECKETDPETSGIILYEEDGELKYRTVTGRERPELMCSTLFGGNKMCRPYMDEVMDAWGRESMDIEEKRAAAEDGDVDLMNDLAQYYLEGDDENDPAPEEAVYWFNKMAEAGNAAGMYNLALHYIKGYGVERDITKAASYLDKSANAGDEDAPGLLDLLNRILDNIKKANEGDCRAQAEVADVYMTLGKSINLGEANDDFEESIKWATRSAEQNCSECMWILALAYEYGRGVEMDMNKAIELYRKGAELGHSGCMNNLGHQYMEGDYIEKNRKEAFKWFLASANLGYGIAMYNVGRCYQFAYGTKGNMKTAVEWFEKALEIIDDPELEQKTAVFKMMSDGDPDWGNDYDENQDD